MITKDERDALRAKLDAHDDACERENQGAVVEGIPDLEAEIIEAAGALLDTCDALERERDEAQRFAREQVAITAKEQARADKAERERDEVRADLSRAHDVIDREEARAEAAEAALARAEADAAVMRRAITEYLDANGSINHDGLRAALADVEGGTRDAFKLPEGMCGSNYCERGAHRPKGEG